MTTEGPNMVRTLSPDLVKPKLEIDYKIQKEFRGEIKEDRALGQEIKEVMSLKLGPAYT